MSDREPERVVHRVRHRRSSRVAEALRLALEDVDWECVCEPTVAELSALPRGTAIVTHRGFAVIGNSLARAIRLSTGAVAIVPDDVPLLTVFDE